MRKIILLCVIYNKKCSESETMLSFFSCKSTLSQDRDTNIELHVWDNSTDRNVLEFNKKYCAKNFINHDFNGNNEFLSVVYNKFMYRHKDDFLLILDDDTNVSKEYTESVVKSVQSVRFHVAVPKIISQRGDVYSPAEFGLVKGRHLDDIASGFHHDLVAISSGMLIDCKKILSENIKFDETLNLYGIDTDFFITLAKRKIKLYVLPVSINHDLSCFNMESNVVKRKRLLSLIKSNIHIAKKRSLLHFIAFLFYAPLVVLKNIKVFFK